MRVVRAASANDDLTRIIGSYRYDAGQAVADQFVDSFERTVARMAFMPRSGAPRYREETGQSTMRCWPIHGFPHLAFTLERGGDLVIVRVLHGARNASAILGSD